MVSAGMSNDHDHLRPGMDASERYLFAAGECVCASKQARSNIDSILSLSAFLFAPSQVESVKLETRFVSLL